MGGAFLVLAAVSAWRGGTVVGAALGALGGLLVLGGLLAPRSLGPVQRAWMTLAAGLSKVTTPVLMGVVYFAVIMPVGFVLRVAGRNPLRRPASPTGFWVTRAPTAQARERMQHLF